MPSSSLSLGLVHIVRAELPVTCVAQTGEDGTLVRELCINLAFRSTSKRGILFKTQILLLNLY